MKHYTINLVTDNGDLIPLTYAPSDYETQADIVADKMARNEEYGIDNTYEITEKGA